MHRRTFLRAGAATLATAVGPAAAPALALTPARPDRQPPAVVLEAFVSQGCDLCPKAEALLGTLLEEFGPERLVAVAFHVDYFNDPWRDPYSDPLFSRRQWQYSTLYDQAHGLKNPSYLYLTPLFLIDGGRPMVASNAEAPALARAAIRAAQARSRPVRLEPTLEPDPKDPRRATLTVRVPAAGRGRAPGERAPLVEVALVEDGLSTAVRSGELAGHTYKARQVVRRLDARPARSGDGAALTFRLALDPGWEPARCRVAILAQDEATGRIDAARQLPWPGA